jgi:predicted nucleic acid-binding protein
MIVISDTSPINYLILIECVNVLPDLYGRVVIPEGVFEELQRQSTPQVVREWIAAIPTWLEVRQAHVPIAAELELLGIGERQAICLAQELGAAAIIIDEEKGRKEARRRGLSVIGLLGVLRDAATRDLVQLQPALARLRETNFRVSDQLIESLLRHDAERRSSESQS